MDTLMHKLKDILGVLIRWVGILLLVVIVIRIVSLLIPSANPDIYIDKAKQEVSSDKNSNSWFDFPDPGSWGMFSTDPVEVKYLEADFTNNPSIQYVPGPSAANNYNR
jgi:hypothetical protein